MKCAFKECDQLRLGLSEFCWAHLPDREDYKKKLLEALETKKGLSGLNLKKLVLKNVHLEKANFGKADLSQSDLSGSHLFNANFDGADLIGADLSACDLAHCDLRGADLTKARLENTRLWNADMRGANLTECNLSGSDLWNAKLSNVKLWRSDLTRVKSLTRSSFSHHKKFSGKAGINQPGGVSAEESYRDLKRHFLENGMYNDASWASFMEKTIERSILKKRRDLHYFPSLVMGLLCGYGEKPFRIVLSAFATIVLFAFAYAFLGAIEPSAAQNTHPLRWPDYIYYSTITFTTVGYGDLIPKPHALFRLIAASEAFAGVFLTGLFIFTLARRYSAR